MKKMTNWEELEWRGLVKDVAGSDIADKINNDSVTFYWGTDPTADSLHLGHYSSLVTAKRLMKMGHKPILLCGGATGRIGDPRPTSEREIISIETLNKNIECIRKQIDSIFAGKAKLVNNYDWFKGYEFLDFLRDIGNYINVNYMLNGKKFGKSEGNALWLDKNKTSSYQLYQYLINTDDSKVLEYLKVFTFLTPEEIEEIIKQHEEKPELRIAQKTLAKCIITDLHGEKEYEKALKISEALFTDKINTLTKEDILNNLNTVPQVELETGNIVDALVNAKVFSSKREARELISGNALSLNNQKITDLEYVLSKENAIDGELYLIRKGKKNYYIGKLK